MKTLYNDFGFIILFFLLVYILENALGDAVTRKLLLTVLLGMLVFNAKKLKNVVSLAQNVMEGASKDGKSD